MFLSQLFHTLHNNQQLYNTISVKELSDDVIISVYMSNCMHPLEWDVCFVLCS